MSRLVPLLTVVAAVALSGIVHGTCTDRWGRAGAIEKSVSRLQAVPLTVGDGDGQGSELSAREVALAEIDGYLRRRYVNRRTGAVVSLLVMCGRRGPVSVHAPDVCYAGAGHAEVGPASRYSCPTEPGADFKVRQFRNRNVTRPTLLRIVYGWGAGGVWSAPKHPRVAFAREPVLIYELAKPDEGLEGSPQGDLLNSLLLEPHRVLVSS